MAHIKLRSQNLRSNLEILAKKAGGKDKIIAVLKDNAYGHGLDIFAAEVAKYGISHAITRNAKEALAIESLFGDVIALSEHKEAFIKHPKIIFAVNELRALREIEKGTKIALKVDTGMHRNGVSLDELEKACEIISQRGLALHSIFTHFRAADEMGGDFFWQKQNFAEVKKRYKELSSRYDLADIYFHSCNSAGLLRSGEFDDDFARIGIAMYGYCDLPRAFGEFGLKPVLELFAKKISQREVKKGQRVGYGGAYEAQKSTISSLYDAGYSDGVFRYDGKGEFRVTDGELILGRVSMDSMSINSDKDEISIFSNAEIWAKHFNTISYDILVKLNANIARKFI